MAEKRMFAKTIIDSDAFLEMPITAQLLYFHLSMRADDDGFINKPKAIMRMCGAKDDDIRVLFTKKFVIPFDSGVVVIKHWKIHNYIRKDTYTETKYKEEKALLELDENSSYRLLEESALQVRDESVTSPSTQVRLGKGSIDKVSVVVEETRTRAAATATEENQLKRYEGEAGRGVVFFTERQRDDLIDRLGSDVFERYVDKLATFIIENNARIKSHYDTILKWYEEDSKVSGKPKGKARHIDFDVDEAFERAMERTYGKDEI
jgi:hypothetical protein